MRGLAGPGIQRERNNPRQTHFEKPRIYQQHRQLTGFTREASTNAGGGNVSHDKTLHGRRQLKILEGPTMGDKSRVPGMGNWAV